MRLQRIAAAAAATALAASLVGCAEAQDAADKAKSQASEAASSAAAKAADKAKDAASGAANKAKEKASSLGGSAFEDVTGKLPADIQKKLEGISAVGLGTKGELIKDADALTAAEFFAARQKAAADAAEDMAPMESVAAGVALEEAVRYITSNLGEENPMAVHVLSSESGAVTACVGPEGDKPRVLTVDDGKVVKNAVGTHDC